MGEPIYCIGKLGQDPATVREAAGQDALLSLIPGLPPGRYLVTRDGEFWGRALVCEDATWELQGIDFSAGPGYVVV